MRWSATEICCVFLTIVHVISCSSLLPSDKYNSIFFSSSFDPKKDIIITPGVQMEVNCYGDDLDWALDNQHPTRVTQVPTVYVVGCKTSNTSYRDVLRKVNVDVDSVKHLVVLPMDIPAASLFEGLTITRVTLNFVMAVNKPIMLNLEIIKSLVNLTEIEVMFAHMFPLPELKLEELHLHGVTVGALGDCKHLKDLTLEKCEIGVTSDSWLTNCDQLMFLRLSALKRFSKTLLQRLLRGVIFIELLRLENQNLKEMPADLFAELPNLEYLYLENINMGENISLSDIKLKSLSYLSMKRCNIIRLKGLPITQVPSFQLDIQQNKIKEFQLSHYEYEMVKHSVDVFIYNDEMTFVCDCQHSWLALALRDKRLRFSTKVKCSDGRDISTVPVDIVECTRFPCGNCTCKQQWSDNMTDINCSGSATSIPRVIGLRALHAPNNALTAISPEDLPKSLLTVDLRHNRLSNIDTETLKVLFSVKDRRIMLAGNLLMCDCETRSLIDELKKHQYQVMDYDNITCFSEGRTQRISELIPSDLCFWQRQMTEIVALAVCVTFIGILAIAGVLGYRYQQEIKVYLFARGWCMQFLHEEEIDSDRLYDAFLSFSHSDEMFVVKELLPILDTEYKLCIHYRDWIVGDFIPTQISRSVEQSRRTIIVLSRSFVESVWGLLEFRTAYMNMMKEGRPRIILIILDDVICDEKLDTELRNYIRSNTYVKWGDYLFWEKMRYAMPHSHNRATTVVTSQVTAMDTLSTDVLSPKIELKYTPEETDADPYVVII